MKLRSAGRIPTPLDQRIRRARVGLLPFVIWVGAGALALELWRAGPTTSTFHGLAHEQEIRVTSPVDARLDSIHVALFEPVPAGAAVATLDATALEASLETARAELEHLRAELDGQRATLEAEAEAVRRQLRSDHRFAASIASLEYPAERRAYFSDEADLSLRMLETRLAQTESELEADRIEVRWKRAASLAARGVGPEAEAEELELRLGQERALAASLERLEVGLSQELEAARERRLELEASYLGPPLEELPETALDARLAGWSGAIKVQARRLEELAVLRASYVLRAPRSGRVAVVEATEGQFLLAGDPVVVLVDPAPRDVALWVPEVVPDAPEVGDLFLVARAAGTRNAAVAECRVRSVSPRLEPLPQRLWRDLRVAEYGRVCLLGPVTALDLVPGERVRIDPAPSPGSRLP